MFGYIVFAACFLLSVAVVYESVKGRQRAKSVSARYVQNKVGNALAGHQDYVNPSIALKEIEKPSEKQPETKDNCVYWYNATYLVWINHDGSVVFVNVNRLNESHLAPAPCGLVAADLKNYKQATDYVLVQDRPQFVNRHVVYADRDNQERLYWIVGDRAMTVPVLSPAPRRFETVQELLKAVDDQKLVLAGDYMLKEVDGTRRPVAKVYSYPVEGNTKRRNICWWIGGWWDGSQWVDSRLHFCSLDTMHVIGTASSSRATFQASNRFTPTDEFVVVNGKPQRLKPPKSEPGDADFNYMTLGRSSDDNHRVDNIAEAQTKRFYLWKQGAHKDKVIYCEDAQSMTFFDMRTLATRDCSPALPQVLVAIAAGQAVPITSKEAEVLRKHSRRGLVYFCKSGTWENNMLAAIRGKYVQYLLLDGISNQKGMRGFSQTLTPELLRAEVDAGRYVLATEEQAKAFWENSINVYTDEDGSLYAHVCSDEIHYLSAERVADKLKRSSLDYLRFADRVVQGKYVPASLEKAATFWATLGHFDDEVA